MIPIFVVVLAIRMLAFVTVVMFRLTGGSSLFVSNKHVISKSHNSKLMFRNMFSLLIQ